MSSNIKKVQCWNCNEMNSVPYGGTADKGVKRCSNCNEVIAESEIDAVTIPSTKQQAMSIKERHDEFTRIERMKRRLGLL